jgi:TnpA family transposase
MGTFNFGKLGQISRVSDPIAKKADRKTALTILTQSILLALGLTLATFALPL